MTLGLKRLVGPALRAAQLPHIDLILLSHAHMDHLDIRTLRKLENAGTSVVTARSTADLLRGRRYKTVREIGWERRPGRSGADPRHRSEALGRADADGHVPGL